MAFAKFPGQPPKGADMAALVKRVDELSRKVMGQSFASSLPLWKRWVGGEGEYDGADNGSIRDVLHANAKGLDALKGDVDAHSQAIIELRQDVQALKEAPPVRPFP